MGGGGGAWGCRWGGAGGVGCQGKDVFDVYCCCLRTFKDQLQDQLHSCGLRLTDERPWLLAAVDKFVTCSFNAALCC